MFVIEVPRQVLAAGQACQVCGHAMPATTLLRQTCAACGQTYQVKPSTSTPQLPPHQA